MTAFATRVPALVVRASLALGVFAAAAGAQVSPAARDTLVVPLALTSPPDTLLMGQPFALEGRIVHPGLTALALVTREADLEPFELADWQRGLDRGDTARVRITLRPFAVGSLTLPPLVIAGETEGGDLCLAVGDSLSLVVASIVPEDATELLDIHEAVAPETPRPLWPWLTGAALLLLALAVLLAVRARRGRSAAEHELVARPAHESALEALKRLDGSPVASEGPWKAYYTELTAIVRIYLARRFGVDAMDMTTTETIRALEPAGLDPGGRTALRSVLEAADAVKFARREPAEGDPRRHLHEAVRFIRLSTPRPVEEANAARTAAVAGEGGA